MPQQSAHALRNSRIISKVVITGTYLVIIGITALLYMSYHLNNDIGGQLFVCLGAAVYIAATSIFLHLQYHRTVAYLLIAFYAALAFGTAWTWGINTPIAPLLFGLVITLSGILLLARHAIFAAIISGAMLVAIQTATNLGWHSPAILWSGSPSSFGDVIAYCVVFMMIALISWLYNREMERLLLYAKDAESALLKQKATLELTVKERTQQLRRSQLEEMQQMYRFAELGQMGVTLLHDLANHLSVLSLGIEGLQRQQQSKDIAQVNQAIRYIEDIIDNTRERLHGGPQKQQFNIIKKISETITFLRYKAQKQNVTIQWNPPAKSWTYTGDEASLGQVIAYITGNGIDAYGDVSPKSTKDRIVTISLDRTDTNAIITIIDRGRGITKKERERLFEPFRTTKKSGMGLGLFIAKQIIEMNFSGSLALASCTDCTKFIITLPLTDEDK